MTAAKLDSEVCDAAWLDEARRDAVAGFGFNAESARKMLAHITALEQRPALAEGEVRAVVVQAIDACTDAVGVVVRDRIADRVAEKLAGRSLAAAFDRAAVAITGQPAAALAAQLAPRPVAIGPDDTAIIDAALGVYSSDYNDAPHQDIARIRAELTGTVLS